MTDIPDDIMQAANECVSEFRWSNDNRWHIFVARAILAERERSRQLLSEAEKRLERAWIIPGPGNEYRMLTRPPAGDEAPSVAIVYRTLLSEER